MAKDQWWYFGPYESSTRIFEISHISRLFSIENYFPLVVLFATLLLAIKTRLIENYLIFTMRKPSDFFLTDGNWVDGIARRWAGFFTHNTEVNRANFKVGNTVIFSNGDKRSIVSTTENGPYLIIWVDGEILNPEDVGLPSKFEIAQ